MSAESGGAAVLTMMVIGLVALVGIASASVGALLAAREQAVTAAEAAALAAAVATYPSAADDDPAQAAARLAGLNGARLVSCSCPVDPTLHSRVVTVLTVVDRDVPLFGDLAVPGRARAEFDPRAWLGR